MTILTDNQQPIYIDLDDVLCDTAGAYIDLVREEFDMEFRFEDIHSFNLQLSFGLTDQQNKHMFACAHKTEFVNNIPIVAEVKKVLDWWKEQGYKLAIVTGRHTVSYVDTLDWLEQHQLCYDSFTMVDKYGWEDTDHNLAISLDELAVRPYSFVVEDNVKMTRFLLETMNIPVLLHDRPWNRELNDSNKLRRFGAWVDLLKGGFV